MSGKLEGDAQVALVEAQKIFDDLAPGARCELKDYQFRIGCGNVDQWGNLQEVMFLRHGLTVETVQHHAHVLAIKVRTGGSTAG